MRSLLDQINNMESDTFLPAPEPAGVHGTSETQYVNLVLQELEKNTALFAERLTRAEMTIRLRDLIATSVRGIPQSEHEKVCRAVIDHLYGYGLIQSLMDDPEVSDIQINGSEYIRYAKNGQRLIFPYNFASDEEVRDWVDRKLKGTPYRYDRSTARTDAFLADGSRLHVKGEVVGVQLKDKGRMVVKPCTIITIRKFLGFYTLEQLVEKKLIDERAYHYLDLSCQIRDGFLLSGGTGSGKTTLMNALVSLTDPNKQIGILEEAPEMQPDHPYVTRYWERPESADSVGKRIGTDINLKDILRMFIDDLYVGEIRDAVMAYQFLQAANTGSGRVGTTLHAKSARGAVNRLMNLASSSPERLGQKAVWDNIHNSINLIIQIVRHQGQRRISELAEIDTEREDDGINLRPIFTFQWTGLNEKGLPDGRLQFHGLTRRFQEQCAMWGLNIPKELQEKDVHA